MIGMTPTAIRRRLPAHERRASLLAAATEVFAAEGYAGASIRQIAEAAGVTIPILYDHFTSKKELHIELLEREGDALIRAVGSVEGDSAEQLMRNSVDALFAYVQGHPFAWRMLFREPPAEPDIAAAHARVMASARAAITGLFALTPRWQTSSALSQEQQLEVLAEGTKSAINGLAAWWWEHRDIPRDEVVSLAMDLLFVGIERLRAPS
jgi:AcrR family transcriptional regulator